MVEVLEDGQWVPAASRRVWPTAQQCLDQKRTYEAVSHRSGRDDQFRVVKLEPTEVFE